MGFETKVYIISIISMTLHVSMNVNGGDKPTYKQIVNWCLGAWCFGIACIPQIVRNLS